MDNPRIFQRYLWMMRSEIRALQALVEREGPAVIASTFPAYAFLCDRLANSGRLSIPYYNVVTDSLSINSLWARPSCTGWFVPNQETALVMRSMGVRPARIHALGFPVPAFFRDHAHELSPPNLPAGATPRVLYIIHTGVRHAWETARRLLAERAWELTITVGRDDALRRRLEALAADRAQPSTILGWTDDIPRLLMTHSVLVSKAGGATTQEAIAACCPMVVNQIVPGQEEGNFELLRRYDAGAFADTPGAIVAALQRAFASRGAVWARWRAALGRVARPNASHEIAQYLLTRAEYGSRAPYDENAVHS